jgi:hypothetical protein
MKIFSLSLIAILFNFCIAFSQKNGMKPLIDSTTVIKEVYVPERNNVKISVTSLIFRNFQFQYERSLTKRIGFVFGYSFIPKGRMPFESKIDGLTSTNSNSNSIFSNVEIGYTAFTPEFRFYLGKGYGKGFYVAPFYRNLKYNITGVKFTYTTDFGAKAELDMGGQISANTFGLQFGAQFNLGKKLILDWWIIGPHYGTSQGDIAGVTNRTLSSDEQASLQKELDTIELPLSEVNAKANTNGADINIRGPWGGIRSGLSLGYRF